MLDLKGYGWMLWDGVQVNLAVGPLALLVALCLGLLGAWGKLSHNKATRSVADSYTVIVRGVPELVLIILVYYGTPTLIQTLLEKIGYDIILDVNSFVTGVWTLGAIYGAFATEVFRGAYLAVPKGEIEAARAIGMNPLLAARRVILPQMWRYALPGLGNLWLVLIKATALMSVIQLPELVTMATRAQQPTRMPFTFYFLVSLIFLAITIVSLVIIRRAEIWAERGVRRA